MQVSVHVGVRESAEVFACVLRFVVEFVVVSRSISSVQVEFPKLCKHLGLNLLEPLKSLLFALRLLI